MSSLTVPKRAAATVPAAKPPCKIHSTAVIADKAQLVGTHHVEISGNTVLHPYVSIRAEGGAVTIGKASMVYENAVVGTSAEGGHNVVIEDYVTIESAAVVEAKSVGEGTEIGVKAVVGKGAVLGKWCKIAALEVVGDGEELEDFTVVFSGGRRRVDKTIQEHENIRLARKEGQDKAVELMRRLIPNGAVKWAG